MKKKMLENEGTKKCERSFKPLIIVGGKAE